MLKKRRLGKDLIACFMHVMSIQNYILTIGTLNSRWTFFTRLTVLFYNVKFNIKLPAM